MIAAADQVAEYRADLTAFADTLDGKRWGPEVTGPIQDMNGQLTALEGDYRDLAGQMRHQGDQGAAAHEQAPWVPDNLLAEEYPAYNATGSPAMVDAIEPAPADEAPADFAAIAARLREMETEDDGIAYLDAQNLDKQGLLAVAAALGLSRLERKSGAEIKRRVIKQAIGARRKHQGLREGWQQSPDTVQPETPPAPTTEALESGPFSQHKLPDPAEDKELRDLISEFFDPMLDKDPRVLKEAFDNAPDDVRDAWRRRADEIARAYGSSLNGPGGLFEHIEPTITKPATEQSPDRAAPAKPVPAATPVSGQLSDKRVAENTWGDLPTKDSVHYHDDGPIGTALRIMGPRDAQMDVDGEPLANVLGQVATDVVRGRRTAQQGVDELKALHDRLPKDSNAHARLGRAISEMDGPASPVPTIPDGTPEPLRQLVHALHAVPLVRAEPTKELEPLLQIIEGVASGRRSPARAASDLRQIRNKRHESLGDAGKFEIDRAIDTAVKALREQR
ncbi:hypothetical protein DMC63_37710 [Streptomyces sp. WAC 05977]|nr:hypothetical protein DMC63_37710 [Streptomyces sp. WAC 05977]